MSNKKIAISGAKWTSISTAVGAIFQFGQVAFLARVLDPSSFGIVSISTLLLTFLGIFAHFGFSNSIIAKQESNRQTLSTIYYLNILIGVVMVLIIYAIAPFLVMYYKEPKLLGVLHISAFYFPIVFLGQIYNILLEKELQFKSLAMVEIATTIIATATTMVFALNGYEEKSLIIGLIAGQFIKMIIQNVIGRKYFIPGKFFNIKEIKDHLIFGAYNIGDSLVSFANNNIDTIVIGGLLGVKELGYYTIALQISIYPVSRLCPVIIQISYPIMAKMKENLQQVKSAYLNIVDFLTYCNIPLLTGLFFMASNVIPLIYGNEWMATIPLVKIFVFSAILSCFMYPISSVAYTTNNPKLLFYLNLLTLIIKLPIIYWMANHYGVIGIAYGFLLSMFISVILNFVLIHYMIGTFMKELLKKLAYPILFSLIMGVFIVLYKNLIGDSSLLHTFLQIIIGGVVFIALTLKFKISIVEIRAILKK